ncbi:MAG: hypothetical protein M3Q17_05170 [Actinomycetota bacterium]|nr:hypothetical protein [Actinomycetota bacterium]
MFTKGDMVLRCFWLVTPFSEALWARAYLFASPSRSDGATVFPNRPYEVTCHQWPAGT